MSKEPPDPPPREMSSFLDDSGREHFLPVGDSSVFKDLGKDELARLLAGPGIVDRVVSGNLVYVTSSDHAATFAVTPDCLRLQGEDGTTRRYRGEPLSSIGIQPGAHVSIGQQAGFPTVTVEYPSGKVMRWLR